MFDTTRQQSSKDQAWLRTHGWAIVDVRRIQGNRYEILARCVGA